MKSILFDLDGTLIDEDYALCQGLKELTIHYPALIHSYNFEDLVVTWRFITESSFKKYLQGEFDLYTFRRTRIKKLFDHVDIKINDSNLMQIFDLYMNAYERNWRLFPDVLPFLKGLNNYRLAILSNGRSAQQLLKVKSTGLEPYFEAVLCPEDVGYAKPSTQAFLCACEILNMTPSQCIYIGDSFDNDVIGSASAGMQPIFLNRVKSSLLKNQGIWEAASLNELRSSFL